MKKIISLFILLFAFSFSMNAQETKKENVDNVEAYAERDTKALVDFLKLEGPITEDLFRLFIYKHKVLAESPGEEQKIVLSNTITKKLEAAFSAEVMAKLSKNESLLKQLTH
uniref:hypothetical protein n=1 Tax=Flavobacterium sp. TaxID=239 RepID=UPI00404A4899